MTKNNKTVANNHDVNTFLNSIVNQKRKKDGFAVLEMMEKITGHKGKMWGSSLIGFGSYHYIYDSGREGDFFKVGFSPRKNAMSIYIIPGFSRYEELMNKLGKFKTGKSCLYVKNLEDVNQEVLKELIKESFDYMTEKHG